MRKGEWPAQAPARRAHARSRRTQGGIGKKKLTVAERRTIVDDLVGYGCSVLRACELAQLHRATFHYQQRPRSDEELLVELTALARQYPRYGYRRASAVLKRTSKVNRKRVHRLWKAAQLQVKRLTRPRKRRERPA